MSTVTRTQNQTTTAIKVMQYPRNTVAQNLSSSDGTPWPNGAGTPAAVPPAAATTTTTTAKTTCVKSAASWKIRRTLFNPLDVFSNVVGIWMKNAVVDACHVTLLISRQGDKLRNANGILSLLPLPRFARPIPGSGRLTGGDRNVVILVIHSTTSAFKNKIKTTTTEIFIYHFLTFIWSYIF